MAASLQLSCRPYTPLPLHSISASKRAPKFSTVRCSVAAPSKSYTITLLPGDGIGPEVISIAKNALRLVASIEGRIPIWYQLIWILFSLSFAFQCWKFDILAEQGLSLSLRKCRWAAPPWIWPDCPCRKRPFPLQKILMLFFSELLEGTCYF